MDKVDMETAYCPDCGKYLPVSEFYRNKAQSSRVRTSSYCKMHQREHDRRWRQENREYFNAYMREYQAMLRTKKRQAAEELAAALLARADEKKQRKEEPMEEAEQIPMFTQRTTGPTCTEPGCKAVLHSYEIGWKKCIKHHRQEAQAATLAKARQVTTQITAAATAGD